MFHDTALMLSFFAVFACVAYQEIRIRKTQNYLVLLLMAVSVLNMAITAEDPASHALLAGIVTAMLGIVRVGGIFKTSDWLCVSALFAFCVGFGIHVAVWSVGAGFAASVVHHLSVCVFTNLARGNTFEGVRAGRAAKVMAMISCKRRDMFDRWAYPAVLNYGGDGRNEKEGGNDEHSSKAMRLDINSGISGKKMDVSRRCPYVIPSIPVLTHMCASALLTVTVLFPQYQVN